MPEEKRNTAVSTSTPVGTAARPLRVAVVGSGPAGVYAADILTKSEAVKSGELTVSIDLFDRYPAPYGLIRYGVAPDHPRIKGIVNALHKVLDRGDIRFFGNVDYGTDLSIEDLRTHYDAVIFATGAIKDADLNIPGIELEGSYGGADFVSWYDGHPDVSREWPLEAKEIAVIGNGNVALDVARDALQARRRPPGLRNPGQRLRRAEVLARSPTCTSSAAADRPRSSSPRWSCANSRTPRTWTSSSTPRTSSSTPNRTGRSRATTRPRPWWARSPTGSPSSPRTSPSSRPPAACTCTSCTARWRCTTTPRPRPRRRDQV